MKRLVALLLAACLTMSLLAACQSSGSAPGTPSSSAPSATTPATTPGSSTENIKIGVIAPLTGATALQGEYLMNGFNFAVKHINADGGINGRNIELVVSDSTSLPEVGTTEFERLANDPSIVAVTGAYASGVTAAIAPLAIKYQVPFMVAHALSDLITSQGPNDYVYRANCGDAESEMWWEQYFLWMEERGTPIKTMATVFENSDYGFTSNDMLARVCKKLGIEVVVAEPVTTGTADLSSVINKLKGANPDFAYVALLDNEAVMFARQMKEYDCNVAYAGCGGGFMAVDYYDKVGDLSDYMLGISFWYPDVLQAMGNEKALALAAEYEEEYGYGLQEVAVSAWTAMYVLADALQRADDAGSIDRESIAQALKTTDLIDSDATIFCPYNHVKFGETAGRYNQNLYSAMPFAQMFDGEWKMTYPDEFVKGENPLVFPVPTWAEREAMK